MGKHPKCSQRTVTYDLNGERPGACFKKASQRVVDGSRVRHRCPDHEVDPETAERDGLRVFPVEVDR